MRGRAGGGCGRRSLRKSRRHPPPNPSPQGGGASCSKSASAAASISSRKPPRIPAQRFIGVEPFLNGVASCLRHIEDCAAKFYDLNKDPIVCPKCHTVLELAAINARAEPEPVRAPRLQKKKWWRRRRRKPNSSRFEEADAEAQGKKTPEGEVVEGAEEEVELEDEGMDDAPFIEEQEEGDEDVTDIIGDVDDEEET